MKGSSGLLDHRFGCSHGTARPGHERLAAAGVEPEFEIPTPPPSTPVLVAMVGGAVALGIVMFSPWLVHRVVGPGSDVPIRMSAVLPIHGSDPLETLAHGAELEERLGDAALLYEAAAQTSADPYLRSAALKLRAFAGECDRAMGRRTGLAGVLG